MYGCTLNLLCVCINRTVTIGMTWAPSWQHFLNLALRRILIVCQVSYRLSFKSKDSILQTNNLTIGFWDNSTKLTGVPEEAAKLFKIAQLIYFKFKFLEQIRLS